MSASFDVTRGVRAFRQSWRSGLLPAPGRYPKTVLVFSTALPAELPVAGERAAQQAGQGQGVPCRPSR